VVGVGQEPQFEDGVTASRSLNGRPNSGHLTLKEIERYTKAYDGKLGAKAAMAKLIAGTAA
jgi:hypothetical protein